MFTETSKLISSTSELLINLLFPRFCVGCGEEGEWLCLKCGRDIVPVVSQVCPECGKLSQNGRYHEKCSKSKALRGIICAAYFEEGPASPDASQGGPVREMIHNLKYNGVTELAEPLADLMAKVFLSNLSILSNLSYLTFTPLHWKSRAQRGYNQAELLANYISQKTSIPIIDALIKTKKTKRQVELKGEKRRKNLKGVFKVHKVHKVLKDKTIIIVDDVYTTGSTLNECARVLKKAGAREVWGLVISRG